MRIRCEGVKGSMRLSRWDSWLLVLSFLSGFIFIFIVNAWLEATQNLDKDNALFLALRLGVFPCLLCFVQGAAISFACSNKYNDWLEGGDLSSQSKTKYNYGAVQQRDWPGPSKF